VNTGATSLTISGISITGANAGDFAIQHLMPSGGGILQCSPVLPAGANCVVVVLFTPTGMGARSAVLTFVDDATGSPQFVLLNGSAPDFSLSTSSSPTATVSQGQTATYTISVAASGGFNQSVTLGCSGAPALTTCTVSPNPVSLSGTSTATATVTITTTAPSRGFMWPFGIDARVRMNYGSRLFLLVLLALMMIVSLFARRRNQRLRWAPLASLVGIWMAMTLTSCGGGSSGNGGGSGSPGTQAGTYTITVSGSSGSSSPTHSTVLTLTVR